MLQMSGDLNARVKGMVSGVSTASDSLYGSSETFARNADDVLKMSETVSGRISDIDAGAHSQTEGAQSSAVAMDEMALGISRISEASAAVSEFAVKALDIAEASQTAMNHTNQQMKSISASTGRRWISCCGCKAIPMRLRARWLRSGSLRIRQSCLR